MNYVNCQLCPRRCGVNRTAGQRGWCRCPDTALVAKAMLHQWEEPALAGSGGSGAIFFGGCTLGCAYCQNRLFPLVEHGLGHQSQPRRAAITPLPRRPIHAALPGTEGAVNIIHSFHPPFV